MLHPYQWFLRIGYGERYVRITQCVLDRTCCANRSAPSSETVLSNHLCAQDLPAKQSNFFNLGKLGPQPKDLGPRLQTRTYDADFTSRSGRKIAGAQSCHG